MRSSRSWRVAGLALALVVLSGAIWIERRGDDPAADTRIVQPTLRSTFAITVTTTGDLRAKSSLPIQGPSSLESQVFQTRISWLVPEGTVVKAGDRVAELDRQPAETRRRTVMLDLQKADGDLTNAALDSSLTLAQAREDVRTAEYALEQARLERDESQFEAPTLRRQAEINLEKADRALAQARRTLDIKQRQAVAKLSIADAAYQRAKHNLRAVEEAIDQFTVRSPADGMVIYLREYGGRRKEVGSTYYIFDPVVATLPDLRAMQSLTYVNEVDVRSIAVGQPVEISLDAEPHKRLHGRVTSVANVGEQHPNEDQKVFEVVVDITEADTTLRPGMTTSNTIRVDSLANVLTVPLRAVVVDSGYSYVYKAERGEVVRQMIEPGPASALDLVVRRGLTADDHILTGPPPADAPVRTARLSGVTPRGLRD